MLANEAEKQLFQDALERPPAERGSLLDRACRGDAALRNRVEARRATALRGASTTGVAGLFFGGGAVLQLGL